MSTSLKNTVGLLLITALLLLVPIPAAAGEPVSPVPFSFDSVIAMAKELAAKPYDNPDAAPSPFIRSLTREQRDKIVFRPETAPWRDENLPFEIRFHHAGFIYNRVAALNAIVDGVSRPLMFTPEYFTYPTAELRKQAEEAGSCFAGFSLHYPFDLEKGPDEQREKDEIASFLGASYFQSRGRKSNYGIYARALAVDTALPDGEEFPFFREFWFEKPQPDTKSAQIYALLDSPRMTGALMLTVIPGTSVAMDVKARFFPRANAAKPGKLGLAPLTSMFLYSETTNGRAGDYRPEIHNSDGLLMHTEEGEWLWNPLANPDRLTVNRYTLENPRGFGLMQRDDNFDHYQDLAARYDMRSSLWIEPQGSWEDGHVELVEIPGSEDYHGNIVAFWVPGNGMRIDSENGMEVAYRLYWMTPGVTPHDLGKVSATRMLKPANSDTIQFIVDFEGERLNALPADTGLACIVETPEQYPVVERRLVKNDVTSGWRLFLKIRRPPKEGILGGLLSPRSANGDAVRFKALLKQGENLPDPLTETWVFDLQP